MWMMRRRYRQRQALALLLVRSSLVALCMLSGAFSVPCIYITEKRLPDGLCAVLDNLPQVPPEKFEKLAGVVKKIISQVGVQIREGEVFS